MLLEDISIDAESASITELLNTSTNSSTVFLSISSEVIVNFS